jgi:ribokinase
MTSHDFDVFGLGQCCIDYLGRVPEYPPPDVKCEFTDLTIQGGGPVATALVALSRWGLRCAMTGIVGDDRLGDEIRQSLDLEGIDTSGLIARPSAESQFAFIVAEPGLGRRTAFWRRPTGFPPRTDEIDYDQLRSTRVFHTDGLFSEASLAAADAARGAGVEVVVDAGSVRDSMLDLARSSGHFIASHTFAESFAPDTEPLEVCGRLAELGPEVVAVTLGERGYVALAHGVEIERPAFAVEAVDTTGCGDVFHAGYVYGLLQGWQIEQRFDFAAWAAAKVAEHLGGRTGIPDPREYPGPCVLPDEW